MFSSFLGLLFIVIGCSDFAPKKPLAVAGENGELLKESLAERDLCDIQQSRKLVAITSYSSTSFSSTEEN